MPFPVGDWQFWVATAAALVAFVVLARKLTPRRWWRVKRGKAVGGRTRVELTSGGKAVKRR